MATYHNDLNTGATETAVEKAFWRGCYCGIAVCTLCFVFVGAVIG